MATGSQDRTKVFGVGLNKTGTTTLGECGKALGYRVVGLRKTLLQDVKLRGDLSALERVAREHDLFQDFPWPLVFEDLDRMFPGSRFILTTRATPEVWLDSLKAHALRGSPTQHSRALIYGYDYPQGHEREHLDFYARHNERVRTYFRDRPADLLESCWENGDGWPELCAFLGCDVPDAPLPHARKGSQQQADPGRVRANTLPSRLQQRAGRSADGSSAASAADAE